MSAAILRVEDLSVAFDSREGLVQAVDGVSFSVAPGRTLGIVGESGSGKTVAATTAMGLTRGPRTRVSGRVLLDDEEDLLSASPARLRALRGAVTPLVTLAGLDVGLLLGGAVLTEVVFGIPGVGRLNYEAIVHADYPVIQGTVLLAAVFVIVANILVDIAQAYLDPRVREA